MAFCHLTFTSLIFDRRGVRGSRKSSDRTVEDPQQSPPPIHDPRTYQTLQDLCAEATFRIFQAHQCHLEFMVSGKVSTHLFGCVCRRGCVCLSHIHHLTIICECKPVPDLTGTLHLCACMCVCVYSHLLHIEYQRLPFTSKVGLCLRLGLFF